MEKGQEFCSLVVELCKDVIDAPMVTIDDLHDALDAEIRRDSGCFDFQNVMNDLRERYVGQKNDGVA